MLQQQLIGGEEVGNKALVERRRKKKKEAERHLQKLKEMARNRELSEQQMINAYKDVNETLETVRRKLEAQQKRCKALERDVQDLNGEFEKERQDYLSTIRKQMQQNKLLMQILHKIRPCIPRDCNYANLDAVQRAAVWDGDSQSWHLPDVTIERTKLPRAESATNVRENLQVNQDSSDSDSGEEFLRQTLARGEEENIAGTYFKAHRQPVINSYKLTNHLQDKSDKTTNLPNKTTWQHLQSGTLYTDDVYNDQLDSK